jgi:hypothetical protein
MIGDTFTARALPRAWLIGAVTNSHVFSGITLHTIAPQVDTKVIITRLIYSIETSPARIIQYL